MANTPEWHYDKADGLLTTYNKVWGSKDHDRRVEMLMEAYAHAVLSRSDGTLPFTLPTTV